MPFKRKDTNRSLDVTKASEGAVIGPVDDSTSDPVDNEMASKKAKHNDEETTTAEVSDGDVIGTEERKVVVEAEVSDGVIVGSDAEPIYMQMQWMTFYPMTVVLSVMSTLIKMMFLVLSIILIKVLMMQSDTSV